MVEYDDAAGRSGPNANDSKPRISVAIECANAEDLGTWQELLDTLQSLQQQTYPLERCEVLVATMPLSTEKQIEIAEALPGVRVVEMDKPIYFRFKNRCLDEARGEIVVLADSDVRYSPEWLESIVGCFDEDPERVIVVGNTLYEAGLLGKPQDLCDWVHWRPESGPTDWFPANNMAVRRKAFEPYRFDDSVSFNGDEAVSILRQRILNEGIQPWFCFDAHGAHTVKGSLARRMRRGAHAYRLRRQLPETRGAWAARVPLLGPVLVVAGMTATALGRAIRYRRQLPGGTLGLPWAMIGVVVARSFDLVGAIYYAWTPDSPEKLRYLAMPRQDPLPG